MIILIWKYNATLLLIMINFRLILYQSLIIMAERRILHNLSVSDCSITRKVQMNFDWVNLSLFWKFWKIWVSFPSDSDETLTLLIITITSVGAWLMVGGVKLFHSEIMESTTSVILTTDSKMWGDSWFGPGSTSG